MAPPTCSLSLLQFKEAWWSFLSFADWDLNTQLDASIPQACYRRTSDVVLISPLRHVKWTTQPKTGHCRGKFCCDSFLKRLVSVPPCEILLLFLRYEAYKEIESVSVNTSRIIFSFTSEPNKYEKIYGIELWYPQQFRRQENVTGYRLGTTIYSSKITTCIEQSGGIVYRDVATHGKMRIV